MIKTPNPFLIAVSYARAAAKAEALITGSTSIAASGDVRVAAFGFARTHSYARTSNQFEALLQRKHPDRFEGARWAITIAAAHAELTVRTTVGPAAEIVSTAGNVDIAADGVTPGYATATMDLWIGGRGTLNVTFMLVLAEVKTTVDGRIYAAGSATASDAEEHDFETDEVDYALDTIRIPDHGYSTGDRIVYEAGDDDEPAPIDGLEHGETYVVLVVDDDTIQLARGAPVDLDLGDAKETSETRVPDPREQRIRAQRRRRGEGRDLASRSFLRDRRYRDLHA